MYIFSQEKFVWNMAYNNSGIQVPNEVIFSEVKSACIRLINGRFFREGKSVIFLLPDLGNINDVNPGNYCAVTCMTL